MYNRFAYSIMQQNGIKVVDAFQVAYPMMHTTKDGAHYLARFLNLLRGLNSTARRRLPRLCSPMKRPWNGVTPLLRWPSTRARSTKPGSL
jgi:hypothetical protein